MSLIVTETSYDSLKLDTNGVSFSEVLPAGDNSIIAVDEISRIKAVLEELRTKISTNSTDQANEINAFIDQLELDIKALQENLEGQINTLSSNLNTTIGANLSDLTAKIDAINNWLDDNDNANAFVSLVDYIKSIRAKINEIISQSVKVGNGVVTISSPAMSGNILSVGSETAGSVTLADASVVVTEVVSSNAYIISMKIAHNQYKFVDMRYPTPKVVEDDATLGTIKVHYRTVGMSSSVVPSAQKVEVLADFTTARPS